VTVPSLAIAKSTIDTVIGDLGGLVPVVFAAVDFILSLAILEVLLLVVVAAVGVNVGVDFVSGTDSGTGGGCTCGYL